MSCWNFMPWVYAERDDYKNVNTAIKKIRNTFFFNTCSKRYLGTVRDKIHLYRGDLFKKF